MSHFTVLVIGENPEDQLAPFQENNMGDCPGDYMEFEPIDDDELQSYRDSYAEDDQGFTFAEFIMDDGYVEEDGKFGYMHNPNSKWDWYQLGGRWTGFFMLKSGHPGVRGDSGIMTSPAKVGTADQALKRDIDFDAMRNAAEATARETFIRVEKIINKHGKPPSWQEINQKHEDIDDAREEFDNHPTIKALGEARLRPYFKDIAKYYCNWDRKKFIQQARDSAITPYAILWNGEWHASGEMGWFGMSSDDRDPDDWNAQVSRWLDSLGGDELLSLYDCHT